MNELLLNRQNMVLLETRISQTLNLQIQSNRHNLDDVNDLLNKIHHDLTQLIERQYDRHGGIPPFYNIRVNQSIPDFTIDILYIMVKDFAQLIQYELGTPEYLLTGETPIENHQPQYILNRQNLFLLENRRSQLTYIYSQVMSNNMNELMVVLNPIQADLDEMIRVRTQFLREQEIPNIYHYVGTSMSIQMISMFVIPFMIIDFSHIIQDEFGTQDYPNPFLMHQEIDARNLEAEFGFISRNLEAEFDNVVELMHIEIKMPKTKSRVLKKVLLDAPMKDVCGICLENHTKKDSVVCNCSHEFGQECLNGLMKICQNNGKVVNCPSCRAVVKNLTSFRERAKVAPRNTVE